MGIPTALTPYMVWIKLIGILILIAALFGAGYHYGSLVTHSADTIALNKLQKQYDDDKQVWADTKTRMAADALAIQTARDNANAAKEAADQQKIQTLTVKYQTTLKEVQNAKQAALATVDHPRPGTDDGLWVDVDTNTCASDPDGRDLVSQTRNGGQFADIQQCRLSTGTAEWLVEEAAKANSVVAQYNECVGSVQVTTAPDASQQTTTTVDNQGAAK
jgi:hypothetical protein